MKKNNKNEKEQLANLLINKAKKKYAKYVGYLDDSFYQREYQKLLKSDNLSMDSYFSMDNLIMKRLAEIVNDGDIELEISLIEEYLPKARFILNKKKIDIKLDETVVMKAIETYQGNKMFSLHILDCTKEMIKSEQQEEPKINQSEDLEKKQMSFSEKIEQYVQNYNIEKCEPTFLENSFRTLSSFMNLDNEDSLFNRFIYLKYGYYHDIYFSHQDIITILNISNEEVSKYYKESLILQKDTLNQVISHITNAQYVKR